MRATSITLTGALIASLLSVPFVITGATPAQAITQMPILDFNAQTYDVGGTNSGWSQEGTLTKTTTAGGPYDITFSGNAQVIGTTQYSNPQVFTLAAWFKTSDNTKKIIGFEAAASGTTGGTYDRHLFIDAGKLCFGIHDEFTTRAVCTTASVNNNSWQHAVATFSNGKGKLFLNGVSQGTLNYERAYTHNGYWRVGGYYTWFMSGGAYASSGGYFNGKIGRASVYDQQLSDADAVALYTESKAVYLGLTPEFGTPTYGAGSITFPITNYDPDFTWAYTPSISATTSVTVSGSTANVRVVPNSSASFTLKVDTSRSGYQSGTSTSNSVAGVCLPSTSYSGGRTILTFTSTSECIWAVPSGITKADFLIVGGGGGGGPDGGSGGGGGEVRSATSQGVTGGVTYKVTVGAGGPGGAWNVSDAKAGSATTVKRVLDDQLLFQANGGSGGGGWSNNNAIGPDGGAGGSGGSGGTGASGQQGGTGPYATCGRVGSSPTGTPYSSSISGQTAYYGGGGGGGIANNSKGSDNFTDGALGGGVGSIRSGGQGANYRKALNGTALAKGSSKGQAGIANTGGGGGAGSACDSYGAYGTNFTQNVTIDGDSYTTSQTIDGRAQRTDGGAGAAGVVVVSYEYRVTYNNNGGSGSISESKFNPESSSPTSATIQAITGMTGPTGRLDFVGWNTQSDASGDWYLPNATYSTAQDLTLYAIWNCGTKQSKGDYVEYSIASSNDGLISNKCTWYTPAGISNIEVLVVGGGGGGGFGSLGGGGGAGEVLVTNGALSSSPLTAYAIGVGTGGTSGSNAYVVSGATYATTSDAANSSSSTWGPGGNGNNSWFGDYIAYGGGGGGGNVTANGAVNVSGSGGGGSAAGTSGGITTSRSIDGWLRYANSGGKGLASNAGAGGGGAGGAGVDATSTSAGRGGAGITLFGRILAGGGGGWAGSGRTVGAGADDSAGGVKLGGHSRLNTGTWAYATNEGTSISAGVSATGSGGGAGATGGSGIVVVRYATKVRVTPTLSASSMVFGASTPTLSYQVTANYSGSQISTSTNFTTSPTCRLFATTDTSFATPIELTSQTNAGTYKVQCYGAAASGQTIEYGTALDFQITKANQTVSITSSAPSAKVSGATYTPTLTASSGLTPVLSSKTESVCTTSNGDVSFIATGTCTIAVNQSGNGNYNAATETTQSFTVAKGDQFITFSRPSDRKVGAGTFTVSPSSSVAGLTVVLSSNDTSICTVSSFTVTLIKVGTCSLTASQTGNSNYLSATPVTQTFTISSMTVTYKSDYPSGPNDEVQSISTAGVTNLRANTFQRTGYTFSGWKTQDGLTAYSDGASVALATDTTLLAQWTIDSYTVTFNSQGGSFISSGTYSYGGSVTDPGDPSRSGYTFRGWFTEQTGGSKVGFPYQPGGTGPITLHAQWSANTYTVTYSYNSATGGNSTLSDSFTTGGATIVLPSPVRTGYTFAGWYSDSNFANKIGDGGSSYSPSGTTLNLDAYAKWNANVYTVTYVYNGATSGNSALSDSFTTGGVAISLPTPVKTGYTFAGWYAESNFVNKLGDAGAAYAPTGSTTSLSAYAKWSINSYKVTFNSQGGSAVLEGSFVYDGTVDEPASSVRTGYTFLGWFDASVGGTKVTFPYKPGGTLDITLYAHWSINTYAVIFDSQGGSSVTDGNFVYGQTVSAPSDPTKTGHTFLGWFIAKTGGSKLTFPYSPGGAEPVTLYAQWSTNSYNVTFNSQLGTAIAASTFVYGNTVADPGTSSRTGYTFRGWFTADSGGNALTFPYAPGVAQDVTLYAQWSANTYTVSFDSHGGTSTASKTFIFDGNLSAPATSPSRTGYQFAGWFADASGGSALTFPYVPTQANDFTLHAQWIPLDYTIEYRLNGGSGVTPQESVKNIGNTFQLASDSNFARLGYTFAGWLHGQDLLSAGDTFEVADSNVVLTAQWTANSIAVTFKGNGSQDADVAQTATADSAVNLRSNSFSRENYTFDGWTEYADGSGSSFNDGQTVTFFVDTTLHAKWKPAFVVAFDSNGGSAVSSVTFTGTALSKPIDPTRTGYTFAGWRNGGNAINWTYVPSGPATLVAQWNPNTYTITFKPNGASGSDVTQSIVADQPTPLQVSSFTKENYRLDSWNTLSDGTGSSFSPSASLTTLADVTLHAIWVRIAYVVTYNAGTNASTPISSATFIIGGDPVPLPKPTRQSFVFTGWYTAATGGSKIGDADVGYSPSSDVTLHARWVQASLYGIATESLTNVGQLQASSVAETSISARVSTSAVVITVPAAALPDGTNISVKLVGDFTRARELISSTNNYIMSFVVSWLAPDETVPNTASGKPLVLTLTDPRIKAGSTIYSIVGSEVSILGRSTADGTATVELSTDPEILIAATVPEAPTSVIATAGSGQATVTWQAPAINGGSDITGYTVTSNDGKSCTATLALTCVVTGLTNGTPYTFTVVATNEVGNSVASVASTAITPVAPTSRTSVSVPQEPITTTPQGESLTDYDGPALTMVNGATATTSIKVVDNTKLVTEAAGVQLELQARSVESAPREVQQDLRLSLQQSATAVISGTGFRPASKVKVWIFSTPTFLGEFDIDDNGKLIALLKISESLPVGTHLLQINGVNATNVLFSQSIPVVVEAAPKSPALTTVLWSMRLKSGVVRLSASKAKALTIFRSTVRTATQVTCIGYFQGSKTAAKIAMVRQQAEVACARLGAIKGASVKVDVAPLASRPDFARRTPAGWTRIHFVATLKS